METLPRPAGASQLREHVAAFQRANRCPLRRGSLNWWVLRRTLLDHPSNDQILEGARVTLEKWFAREQPWGAQIIANVRGVVRRRAIELPDYCSVAATSDGLRPRLTMAGDTFASVALELLYFGGADAMPWPVLDTRGEWLPHDCVWALDLVGAA